jgi:hypothetical protein
MIVVLFIIQSWSAYLDSSLVFIGIQRDELSFRSDYTIRDIYRFAIADQLLEKPLTSVGFLGSLEEFFWQKSDVDFMSELISLYGFKTDYAAAPFLNELDTCHALVRRACAKQAPGLLDVFEELTLFSPDLTSSIEEENANEQRSDSLVIFLRDSAATVQYDLLLEAGLRLLAISHSAFQWADAHAGEPVKVPDIEGAVVYRGRCAAGEIVIGGSADNVYHGTYAVIIDLGGDDSYFLDSTGLAVQLIVDCAGDDRYVGKDYAIACGTNGISILIDEGGNDEYLGRSFSIGCGVFGCGILIDKKGNDRYSGDTFTQGAAGFGIGILKDEEGNDIYEGALYAQGFGSTYGIGIIGDAAGNDMYIITEKYIDEIRYLDHYLSLSQGFAIGFRPDLSAGIGLIFEQAGNDYYLADIFAQGSSYWYGLGAIVDREGNDNYIAYQYAQGAGTHITVGVLIDRAGHDNYVSKGVSQGCGHDLSLGLLYDVEGDDTYAAFDLSQGAGNANGIGVLLDESGDDSYSVKRVGNTQGYGDFRREYGSIGILLDIKGDDTYRSGTNRSLWEKGKYGIGIDWE